MTLFFYLLKNFYMIYSDQFPLPLLLLGPFSRPYLSNCKPPFSLKHKEEKVNNKIRKQTKKTEKKSKRNIHAHISTNHRYPHTNKIQINTKLETVMYKQKTSKV